MFRQLVQDVGGWRDGVGAKVELEPGLLGGGEETVGRGLVAGDVHVASGVFLLGLYAVSGERCRGVGVGAVIVPGLNHLDVSLGHSRLLGELLTQEVVDQFEVAVEEPAHEAQGEHVAAFQHALVVHVLVLETRLDHLSDWACHHAVVVYAHLLKVVIGLELRLVKVVGSERVGVYYDSGRWLGIFVLSLQRRGVHGHEHVALVARGENLSLANVHLEAAHACQ